MSAIPQVIVVGSGPAGVSVAWPLVRAGVPVRMIDASPGPSDTTTERSSLTESRTKPMDWRDRFGADLSMLGMAKDISPKIATPKAQATLAGFAAGCGIDSDNFCAMGSLARGGLSNIWGALALPFDQAELAESAFDAAAMRRSYRAVTRRIGVSGGPGADPDILTSAPARRLLARHRRQTRRRDFDLEPASNAVLQTAQGDRLPCSRCGSCLYGCSRGSIYNSAAEIPALLRFANFSYTPGHFVHAVRADGSEQVLDVEVSGIRRQLRATTVVLAAGTLVTSGLALRRIGWIDRPVRLLTNPVAAAAFLMPRFIGQDLPGEFLRARAAVLPAERCGRRGGRCGLRRRRVAAPSVRSAATGGTSIRAAARSRAGARTVDDHLLSSRIVQRKLSARSRARRQRRHEYHRRPNGQRIDRAACRLAAVEARAWQAWRFFSSWLDHASATGRGCALCRHAADRGLRARRDDNVGRTARQSGALHRRRRLPAAPPRHPPDTHDHGQRRPHRPRPCDLAAPTRCGCRVSGGIHLSADTPTTCVRLSGLKIAKPAHRSLENVPAPLRRSRSGR